MTTQFDEVTAQIDEVTAQERSIELLGRTREKRSEVRLFTAEAVRKPLVAFDALPASTALPLTWDSGDS